MALAAGLISNTIDDIRKTVRISKGTTNYVGPPPYHEPVIKIDC
jgi:hypothetical protein